MTRDRRARRVGGLGSSRGDVDLDGPRRSATSIGMATSRSIAAESEARARREAGGDADDEDESEEDERACPGLGVPVVVGCERIGIDLHWKRGDRLRG